MNWTTHVRNEFVRVGQQVDESVVEELAQHAAAAFEEARAEGQPPGDAEALVRPSSNRRLPVRRSSPASRST
jgi:hypothetical protein